MNVHEVRLRAMSNPKSEGWGLSDDDRAAIQWVFDAMFKLKDERDEAIRLYSGAVRDSAEYRKKVEAAVVGLLRVGTAEVAYVD